MQASEAAALQHGFSRLELVATLTGEPLYRAHGFSSLDRFDVALGNGGTLPVVRMTKDIVPQFEASHLP